MNEHLTNIINSLQICQGRTYRISHSCFGYEKVCITLAIAIVVNKTLYSTSDNIWFHELLNLGIKIIIEECFLLHQLSNRQTARSPATGRTE